MKPSNTDTATLLLADLTRGSRTAAISLSPLLYSELRALAASFLSRERPDHTLQPTALANEAYLKLIDQSRTQWNSKAHFMAVAAEIIRRILVDHARAHNAQKRGGGHRALLDESVVVTMIEAKPDESGRTGHPGVDLVDLDDALKTLHGLCERQARVVELRFFAGMDINQCAEVLGVSPGTVKGDWRVARAWLKQQLGR